MKKTRRVVALLLCALILLALLPVAALAEGEVDRDNLMVALASASVKTEANHEATSYAALTAAVAAAKELPEIAAQTEIDAAEAAINTALAGLVRLPLAPYTAPAYQMEYLTRGLVAILTDGGVFLSWRYLGTDDPAVAFNLYRDGEKINASPLTGATNYLDAGGTADAQYTIATVLNDVETLDETIVTPWTNNYMSIPLQKPAGGRTLSGTFEYRASDSSAGDADGDGVYEIFVKWDPTNAKDNSQSGHTGNTLIDCYKLDGELLWRIDLGVNIRSGAHYTQFMVYDLNGDGKAELVCKTADGTVDGIGQVIGDASRDYRNSGGYILDGPEYLTVFNCENGAIMHTVNYDPPRTVVSNWGDTYGNRVDRFLACVAYLDGVHPSVVMCRGYYSQTFLVAFDLVDGQLVRRASFYSSTYENGSRYEGQGNHSVSVADVDNDGKDEIVYGAIVFDDDLTPIHRTGLGHGDAQHTGDLDPTRPGLEIFSVHESAPMTGPNYEMRDALTGEILWGVRIKEGENTDVGRGMSADIDPRYAGSESWTNTIINSSEFQALSPLHDARGNIINGENKAPQVPANFAIWWDGDLEREMLDSQFNYNAGVGVPTIFDWNWKASKVETLLVMNGTQTNNSTKANPMLQADLFGDWREEVVARTDDSTAMRIYSTTALTTTRLYTLMHNRHYRLGVAWQNVAYNQPPNLDYFLGTGMEMPRQPNIAVVKAEPGTGPVAVLPGTPENFVAVEAKNEYATLSWDFVVGARNYEVYIRFASEPASAYRLAANVYSNQATVLNLLNNRNYYAKVRAVNAAGVSEFSEEILLEIRYVAPAAVETFEEHTASELPWSAAGGISGNGSASMSQSIETYGATGKAGRYQGSGSGSRGIQLNLHQPIAYDLVVFEADWYAAQGTRSGNPYLKFAIQDGKTSTAGGDNQFITFAVTGGKMYYFTGNLADGAALPASAAEIISTAAQNKWYHLKVELDFASKLISFKLTDPVGAQVAAAAGVPFAASVNYKQQVESFRFLIQRSDAVVTTYLDNVYIGPKNAGGEEIIEADKDALIAAVAAARALDAAKFVDFSAIPPLLAWADDVIADITAPQTDVDACLAALNAAVGNLVKIGTVITPKNSLISVKKGKTFQIVLTTDVNSAYIKYTPLNPLVATVSDTGLITGVKAGTTMILITSTDGSKITKSLTINVTN